MFRRLIQVPPSAVWVWSATTSVEEASASLNEILPLHMKRIL